MSGGDPSGALRGIRTLFSDGMLVGLTDRQLLERFANRSDTSAEDAFTILLERHGPLGARPLEPAHGIQRVLRFFESHGCVGSEP